MNIIGSVGVRVLPSMAGFGASVGAAVAGSGSVLSRAGASASVLLTAPIVAGLAKGVSEAVSFESAFAGVRKTVNASEAELQRLSDNVVEMANRMPFAREAIASVMEAAGRFGVPTDQLAAFTETAVKLGTATNVSAQSAAEQLIRLANITQTPYDQIEQLGSAVVALGNDFPTTEGEILKFAQRLGQISAVAPVTAQDVAGIAAGMASLGIRAEAGGTAMSRVFFTMNSAVLDGGEKLKAFSDIAGTSADEFATLFRTKPVEAVELFLGGIKRLNEEGANVPAILKGMELGEIRVRDAILRTSNGLDVFSAAVDTANAGFAEGTALQTEYDKRAATTASQWEILKNRASNVARILGESLLPVLNDTFQVLTPFVDAIALAAEAFARLPEPVRNASLGLALFVAAIGPTLWLGSRVVSMVSNLGLAFGGLGRILMAHPILILVAALITAAVLLVIHWDTVKAFFADMWDAIGRGAEMTWQDIQEAWDGATAWFTGLWDSVAGTADAAWDGVAEGFTNLWGDIQSIGSEAANTVGGLFGATASTIWGFLEPVRELGGDVFGGMGTAASSAWDEVMEATNTWYGRWTALFTNVTGWTNTVWDTMWGVLFNDSAEGTGIITMHINMFRDLWSGAWNIISSVAAMAWNNINAYVITPMVFTLQTLIPLALSELQAQFSMAWGFIQSVVAAAWQDIQSKWDSLLGVAQWIIDKVLMVKDTFFDVWYALPEIVRTAVGKIQSELGKLASALDRALGPIDEILTAPFKLANAGFKAVTGRAAGGMVNAHQPYLVGERGPEIVSFPRSGYVTPNHMIGTGGSGVTVMGPLVAIQGPVYVRNDQDLYKLAQGLDRETDRALRALGSGQIRAMGAAS